MVCIKKILFKHHYRKSKIISYNSQFGVLQCEQIVALTKSSIGTTKAKFLFNSIYGFVYLEFENIDGTTIKLELIK